MVQIDNHVKDIMGSLEPHDNPTTLKIAYDDIKEVFLAKEWNSFHLSRKKLDYLHLKDFLKYKCELHLKQPINTTTMQDHCCLLHLES